MINHRLHTIRVGVAVGLRKVGEDKTRRDGIDGASLRAPFDGQRADHPIESRFGRPVGGPQLLSVDGGDRGGDETRPTRPPRQERPKHLACDEGAVEIRVDDLAKVGILKLGCLRSLVHSRIGDEDVE